MPSRAAASISKALKQGLLVKFYTKYEEGPFSGYVLRIGKEFFMASLIEDAIRFNGFGCFRFSDIRNLEVPHKYAATAEKAVKRAGVKKLRTPGVKVSNISDLLLSANRLFPLIAIHREKIDMDVCWIGRVVEIQNNHFTFSEINPDAKWEKKHSKFKLSEITRVGFGSDYEKALMLATEQERN